VIDLLVPLQTLINHIFDTTYIPNNRRVLFKHVFTYYSSEGCSIYSPWILSSRLDEFFRRWQLSKAIIFQCVPDDFDIAVPHVKKVTSIWRQIRSNLNRILIDSEHQVLFPDLVVDLDDWLVFEQH
jgi:hypothetical protein